LGGGLVPAFVFISTGVRYQRQYPFIVKLSLNYRGTRSK